MNKKKSTWIVLVLVGLMSLMMGLIKRGLITSSKKSAGITLVLVGLVVLIGSYSWLHTGDIHRPGMHFVMRGGWLGFWFTTVMGALCLAVGALLLVKAHSRSK